MKKEKVKVKNIFPLREKMEATGDIITPAIHKKKAGKNRDIRRAPFSIK